MAIDPLSRLVLVILRRNFAGGFKRNALQPFVKIQEITFVLADINITQAQVPGLLFKLQEDAVKFIQLLGGAIGLNRNIIICYGGHNFNTVCQVTIQLKVKAGGNYGILAIAKCNAPPKTTGIVNGAKIKKFIGLPEGIIIKYKGLSQEIIHDAVVVQVLGNSIQFSIKYAVFNPHTVNGWLLFP